MYRTFELIGPRRIGENSLDAGSHFPGCPRFAHDCRQAARDFFLTQRKVFRHVIKNLRAIVSGGLSPPRRFARGFDSVTNILSISERRLPQQFAALAAHLKAVARIGSCLLSPDVEFYCTVDCWISPVFLG